LEYDSWGFPDYHSPDISRGKNLKTIGKSAFANNGFTDISLPDSLEVI
jgi:hypothetical protein